MLPLATGDTDRVLGFAARAEQLGFDGVFGFDHLFPPGAPPDRPSLEVYATLAAVAAATERIRVGTLVTRASLRSVGMLAKQVACLDEASAGRFVLGIGTGDEVSRGEHEAFGLPLLDPGDRREHLAETVSALRALFAGAAWPGGRLVPAIAGPLLAPPRSPGGPPIWVGGASEQAVRLAARLADGWNGWDLPSSRFAARAALLREAAGGRAVEATWAGVLLVGTDAGEVERLASARRGRGLDATWAGPVEQAEAFLGELRDAGAGWAIALAAGPPDRVELIAERILPRLRAQA
jgi:alkanesulfonate monooxygenase SsuD/methylene tetrahydromethanopterin reductase-like flavin-dependent oxidoreductase (luciferase family)